jgi:hypothetical protein
MNHPVAAPLLDEYVDHTELLPLVKNFFPTRNSLRWYVRRHRATLAQCGAIISVAGRHRFHPQRFMRAVVETGMADAA